MIRIRSIVVLIFLLLLVVFQGLGSNEQNLSHRFQYLTIENGLPQNTVDDILCDSQGFMWFATWGGLCRFDGYGFETFRPDESETGLSSHFVYALAEDNRSQLWIGTLNGPILYDLNLGEFVRVSVDGMDLSALPVKDIYCSGNRIWLAAADSGLVILEQKDHHRFSLAGRFSGQSTDEDFGSVFTICHLDQDRILIGTSQGAFLFSEQAIKQIVHAGLRRLTMGQSIISAYYSPQKELWLGSNNPLFRMNNNLELISAYYHSPYDKTSLAHGTVNSVCSDARGNILVGTLGGLCIFDEKTNQFVRITDRQGEQAQLNNVFVNSLFADEKGVVWIGTDKGGINRYNIFENSFNSIGYSLADRNSLSHPTVNSIFREKNRLWVGTAGGGLNLIETDQLNSVSHFKYDPSNATGISSDFISSIIKGPDGKIYIGTWGTGINCKADNSENRFEHFLSSDGPNDLSNNFISVLYNDPRGYILIATEGGLNLFDPQSRHFSRFPTDSTGNGLSEVGCIELDHKGYYWAGTRKGLFRFSMEKAVPGTIQFKPGEVMRFLYNHSDHNSIPGNFITALKEDSKGQMWLGTYGNGIAKVKTAPGGNFLFETYSQSDGLSNNVIYSIEEDKTGLLWISSDNGLSAFDPVSKRFVSYYERDGLMNNQYYWSASFADKDGNLYFGGVNGLNYFDPARINEYVFENHVVFTNLKVFNSVVRPCEERHGHLVMNKPLYMSDTITLSYRDNVFSIEFSALDYAVPEKISYAYMMDGVDNDWVYVNADRRFATYTNLRGGEYLFKVRCTNSAGDWSEAISVLKVRIIPPFYATNWFRIIAMIVIMLLVMAYVRWSTINLIQQKKKLEKLVSERTLKIEEQKEVLVAQSFSLKENNQILEQRQNLIEGQKAELEAKNAEIMAQRDQLIELNEQVQNANQLKLRFFTNISHEFRTPLTLIIDPIQSLIDRLKEDKKSVETLRMIDRNAQRLLHLINQLMYFRRIENNQVVLHAEEADMVGFVEDIFNSFRDLAFHQHIDFQFFSQDSPDPVWIDKEKMENILYNLLSNAFKFTPTGGRIVVQVRFEQDIKPDLTICKLQVEDSGIGIDNQHLDLIFDRFYQVGKTGKSTITGSGIGLSLTRELVEALRGTISVESEAGKGTTFRLNIPCSKAHFNTEELVSSTDYQGPTIDNQVALLTEELLVLEEVDGKTDFESGDRHKPLILIAEDHSDLRKFLIHNLSDEYRVIGVGDGKEGTNMATRYTPDLIISDVMMPFVDGIEFCQRIKTNIQTSHIPVILLTAKALTENWIEGLETGADDFIPKPFNLDVLKARIKNLIENRKRMIRLFSKDLCPDIEKVTTTTLDEEFLQKTYTILDRFYIQPEFSVEDFAREMCISKSLLYKKLKSLTGMSISDYVNNYKIKKSLVLLREGRLNVSDIAFHVGFNDPKYFSRVFRKFVGMTPTAYAGE